LPSWIKPVALVVLLALVVAGITWYIDHDRRGRYMQETNNAYVKADQVSISSKLAGFVNSVPVVDNQVVRQGDLLVVIDPTDYTNRIAAADADIRSAFASERATRSSVLEAEASVEQARAALAAAQADLAFANRELARYAPLVQTGAEPASQLSRLRAERDKAQAQVAAQRAQVMVAQRRVGSVAAQADQSLAAADAARVQRQSAASDLSRTQLTSPIAGRVANSNVRVGQFVQPGTALMTVVPVNDVYIEANFKETQIGLMRPGQSVEVRVDALDGVVLKGEVASISPGTGANFSLIPPENATGNFTKIVQRVPVRIRLVDLTPESRQLLVPGLSAEVTVDTRTGREALERLKSGAGK
jgi:membrane fusion protein (multidrug efflux system)